MRHQENAQFKGKSEETSREAKEEGGLRDFRADWQGGEES